MKKVLLYATWVVPAIVGFFWLSPWWSLWFFIPLAVMANIDGKIAVDDVDPNGNTIYFFYFFKSQPIPDRIPPGDVPVKVLEIFCLPIQAIIACLLGWTILLFGATCKRLRNFLRSYELFASPSGH